MNKVEKKNAESKSKSKPKRTNLWYRSNESERIPLLPKRKRHRSCTVDYGTSHKNTGYVNPVLSDSAKDTFKLYPHLSTNLQPDDTVKNQRRLKRRNSFPLSSQETNLIQSDKSCMSSLFFKCLFRFFSYIDYYQRVDINLTVH